MIVQDGFVPFTRKKPPDQQNQVHYEPSCVITECGKVLRGAEN